MNGKLEKVCNCYTYKDVVRDASCNGYYITDDEAKQILFQANKDHKDGCGWCKNHYTIDGLFTYVYCYLEDNNLLKKRWDLKHNGSLDYD